MSDTQGAKEAGESANVVQRLEALLEEQGSLKKQLVDLQRAEADHLQTISELKDRHAKALSTSAASAESELAAAVAGKEIAEANVSPFTSSGDLDRSIACPSFADEQVHHTMRLLSLAACLKPQAPAQPGCTIIPCLNTWMQVRLV